MADLPESRPDMPVVRRTDGPARFLPRVESAVVRHLEGVSDAGRWTLVACLMGGGGLMATSPILAAIGALSLGAGVVLAIINIRMARIGYAFPDTVSTDVGRSPNSPDSWQVDLVLRNPGRPDAYRFQVLHVTGFLSGVVATGTSLKWKGETDGDWKLIEKGGLATAYFLKEWKPQHDKLNDIYSPHLSTIQSSTGPAPLTIQAGSSSALIYLQATSRQTGNSTVYEARLELANEHGSEPKVRVRPLVADVYDG